MPRILETKYHRVHWGFATRDTKEGGNATGTIYEPDWMKIDQEMNKLLAEFNDNQWEIKSIVPLISARSYTEGLTNHHSGIGGGTMWGAGYGYAAPYTEGVVVLAQRWVEVSEEGWAEFERQRQEREKATSVTSEAERRQAEHDRILAMPIDMKPGIMGTKWLFNGHPYATGSEAGAARAELALRALKGEQ